MVKTKPAEYICDRCGKEYEFPPRKLINGKFKIRLQQPTRAAVESVVRNGYIVDSAMDGILPQEDAVQINAFYSPSFDYYDLCPDCARMLKKFLQNKI